MTKMSDLKRKWMQDPQFRAEYQKADADYSIIEALVRARQEANLSQADLARKIGTTQSAVARLESGNISPSISTLQRYAAATGTRLRLELVSESAA